MTKTRRKMVEVLNTSLLDLEDLALKRLEERKLPGDPSIPDGLRRAIEALSRADLKPVTKESICDAMAELAQFPISDPGYIAFRNSKLDIGASVLVGTPIYVKAKCNPNNHNYATGHVFFASSNIDNTWSLGILNSGTIGLGNSPPDSFDGVESYYLRIATADEVRRTITVMVQIINREAVEVKTMGIIVGYLDTALKEL